MHCVRAGICAATVMYHRYTRLPGDPCKRSRRTVTGRATTPEYTRRANLCDKEHGGCRGYRALGMPTPTVSGAGWR